jgi:hypothetical protein
VFKLNQIVVLPELAAQVGLQSPEFKVDRTSEAAWASAFASFNMNVRLP